MPSLCCYSCYLNTGPCTAKKEPMTLKITGDALGIIHVHADTQAELCHAFVRMQEFYESPFPTIRAHHFTVEEFEAQYKGNYYADWHGFNIPGDVVRKFEAIFADLSESEKAILAAVKGLPRFYIIGTHEPAPDSDDEPLADVIAHERAHARYYLDPSYRKAVNEALTILKETHRSAVEKLVEWLAKRGYSSEVVDDEINAYLATTDQKWWAAHLDEATAIVFHQIGEPFRYLLQQRERTTSHGVEATLAKEAATRA